MGLISRVSSRTYRTRHPPCSPDPSDALYPVWSLNQLQLSRHKHSSTANSKKSASVTTKANTFACSSTHSISLSSAQQKSPLSTTKLQSLLKATAKLLLARLTRISVILLGLKYPETRVASATCKSQCSPISTNLSPKTTESAWTWESLYEACLSSMTPALSGLKQSTIYQLAEMLMKLSEQSKLFSTLLNTAKSVQLTGTKAMTL